MMIRSMMAMAVLTVSAHAQLDYKHFEARQVHPIGLTPDGAKVLAVNSPDARLSVFDAATMSRVVEIPVGLEPVTVRARTNDEVWVVSGKIQWSG